MFAVSAVAQDKAPAPGQLPAQGPPPKNLTKLPDGHFSANTDPKNVENFEVRVVVAGDTLSGIAKDVLKDGKLWPQVWEQNEHIINPHWIYPNDKILIRPVTKITEAKPPEPVEAAAEAPVQAAEPPKETTVVREPPKPFIVPPYPVTDQPRGPQVILDLAPPRVYPEVKAADLYCSGFIRNTDVPRDIKIVARYGNDEVMAGSGDYVYIGRGASAGVKPGTTFEVVRPTKRVNSLGTHYLEVAQVEIVMGQADYALARVTQGCEAVEVGDVLIPYTRPDFPTLPANRPFSGTMKGSGQVPGRIATTKSTL
jgi:LysM repeat protein